MSKYTGMEIAIIGMAGRFPGANTVEAFWDNLKAGVESIQSLSDEELLAEGESKSLLALPNYVKVNSFIDDKAYFDSEFFGYRPAEAQLMNPQIRLFHELCWNALEDGGYGVRKADDKIGLFAGGVSNTNWENYAAMANMENLVDDYTAAQLRNITFLSSRVSYALNLQGPVVYLNTACSTSLVTIQRACMSLLLRECNMALAGGVALNNYTKKGYVYQEGMINSPDGHCRAFDADANGTIGGEGAGVVLLKRLSEAMKDGDHIYAIVKGCAVNNDGNDKTSFTAPSVEGQYKTILKALNMARVPAESISLIEAHGTGTKLGDPIEIEALNLAFGKSEEPYCAIGSVKTNIGHLDIAAGVTGFIKAALALKNRQLPPSLNFEQPNPKINFKNSPFFVNTKLREWPNGKHPRRAGVSSFGIGGTNAHIILEEAPRAGKMAASRSSQLLLLSAKTAEGLEQRKKQLSGFLQANSHVNLADTAYTLKVGRADFKYRQMVVCQNREEAIEQLDRPHSQRSLLGQRNQPDIVFMFSGQGSQYVNMCLDLYKEEKFFRTILDDCLNIAHRLSGKDLRSILFPKAGAADETAINQTEFTQPILFMVEYALAKMLMKWGLQPDALIGHSIGEYTAACISGVLSLEDALRLVLERGTLMQQLPGGDMLSVAMSEADLREWLNGREELSLATVNSSEMCVVSGTQMAIQQLQEALEAAAHKCKRIRTSHAFHSFMMDDILEAFEKTVDTVTFGKQQIPIISNLTGERVSDDTLTTSTYWSRHLREAVLFAKGLETVLEGPRQKLLVEIGPGKVLSTFANAHIAFDDTKHKAINLVRHPLKQGNDFATLLAGIGNLWMNGAAFSWPDFYEAEQRKRCSLPTYPFEKRSYPVNVDAHKMILEKMADNPLSKNPDVSQWFYVPSWKLRSYPAMGKTEVPVGKTLVFTDEVGIAKGLIQEFEERREEVVVVQAGETFSEHTPTAYQIRISAPSDYQTLFQRLQDNDCLPDRIVHAWGIEENPTNDWQADFGASSFFSLTEIIKQVQAFGSWAGRKLLILTNDLHPLSRKGKGWERSSALALMKVLMQEYPRAEATHIDFCSAEKDYPAFYEQLYTAVANFQKGKIISLRHQCHWEQIFDPIRLEAQSTLSNFRQGATYLITGGLGSLGYHLSQKILEKCDVKIVLLGRAEQLSPSKQQRLGVLRELSDEVCYLSCDIADLTSLVAAVDKAEKKFGKIQGVIHAAGTLEGKSINFINELEREDYALQNQTKLKGLQNLKEVFGNHPLDFCLLTSSLSTVLGGLRFAAYAAANTAMDYFVCHHRSQDLLDNWITVNLDGLELDSPDTQEINATELFDLFERIINHKPFNQLVVSTRDLNSALEKWVYGIPVRQADDSEPAQGASQSPKDIPILSEEASLNEVEQSLLNMWKDFFGKSELEVQDDFFDIGGDSLKALTMIGRMEKEWHISLSITDFFNSSSVQALSERIMQVRETTKATQAKSEENEIQEEFIF
ncbi:MAG: SDR family NAD(P)-dependent oxidoreductase [Bacteroidota bacterium]